MSNRATALLEAFEALPKEDQNLFTAELLNRAVPFIKPPGREQSDRWLQRHREEYEGKWVALQAGTLIAAGDDGKAVYDQARAAGVDCPLLLHLVRQEHPSGGF